MKDINLQNLDEWLFEYFEGNLNEADSERLLSEVGKNSLYIEEFNLWKKTYLTDYPSIQYSSSDRLKKRSIWKNYWISVPILLLALLGIALISIPSDEDSVIDKNESVKNYLPQISNEKSIIKESVSSQAVKTLSSKSASNTNNDFNERITSTTSIGASAVSEIAEDTLKTAIETQVSIKDTTTVPNEITNETTEIIVEKSASSNEKKKKKSTVNPLKNLHLKPTEEINKMNSDF